MQIGARIRAARLDRRMTLTALAGASGLTKGFISQLESGSSGVSLVSLERIAAALELPLVSLMSPEGYSPAEGESDVAPGPLLIAARNLYQETTGLAQLAAASAGAHFLASLPPFSMFSSPIDLQSEKRRDGIAVVLQGSLLLRHFSTELRVSAGEVASWDCAGQYSLENHAATLARALIFMPDGAPLPALVRLPRPSAASSSVAYAAGQGPMRLVEMRARRQAERRR